MRTLLVPAAINQNHAVTHTAAPQPAPAPADPVQTLIAAPITLIASVLDAVSDALASTGGPGTPQDNPLLWALAAWVRRQDTADADAPAVVVKTASSTVEDTEAMRTTASPMMSTLDSPAPVPISDPGVYGSLADYLAQPSLESFTSTIGNSWYTTNEPSFIQDSGFGDPTGSASLHLDGTITRPADDPDIDNVYVVQILVDYKYFDGTLHNVPQDKVPILSVTPIAPGETVNVQDRIVEIYEYPDGPSGPRTTLTDQRTQTYIARLSAADEDVTAPTAPKITTTDRTTTTVDLVVSDATDNVGVVSYKIYRNGQLITFVSDDNGSAKYTDTGLLSGVQYAYTATALDAAGNESPLSAPPLLVTTNVDTNPGTGHGCDEHHTCPDPNNIDEQTIERINDGIDLISAALLGVPVIGPALSLAFGTFIGTPVGLVNLAGDALQYYDAVQRGDATDIADERADILDDVVGFVPGASQLHGVLLVAGLDWPWENAARED
jgi:hypothetical protein